MALADTAALVSSLELKDKFTPTVNKYDKAITQMERQTSTFGKVGGRVGQGLSTAAANLTKLALVGGAAIGSQVKFGLDALKRLDDVTIQTNAVLRSTAGVAGETADSIRNLANKYEDLNATIDDKVIQSGENLLLTFTNIRTKAFEPALQAALDMNQAMGGGEAGLQGTIQKLGKALNDPVKGLSLLGRAGITFSADQKKQIADLVKHNKLYDAQKVILDELTKRFGGSFAAAGNTATGTFAKLRDAVEDAQMSLATALLPALVDIAKELNGFLRDPAVLAGIKDFGKGLADAFRDGVKFAKQIPWKTIGDGLRTAATAAGNLVKAFNDNVPDWLKTAIVTGWGLNKLTGGALTGIGGDLLKGLGDRFLSRGSSPVNPLFVSMTGVPGVAGVAGAGATGIIGKAASIAQKVFIVGLAAEAADLLQHALGGTLEDRTNAGTTVPGDQLSWPWGPKNTPHFDLGPLKDILGGDSNFTPAGDTSGAADTHSEALRTEQANTEAVTASIDALRANTVALATNATRIERAWLKTIDPKDINARSKAVTGHNATPAQIAAIRSRDILHQLVVITTKSKASNETKLARLQALAKEGDPKTRAKVNTAIAEMKAKIAAEQQATTNAVTTGTSTLATAIATSRSDLNVYVTTNVSANGVVKAVTHAQVYGPSSTNKGTTPTAT